MDTLITMKLTNRFSGNANLDETPFAARRKARPERRERSGRRTTDRAVSDAHQRAPVPGLCQMSGDNAQKRGSALATVAEAMRRYAQAAAKGKEAELSTASGVVV